MPGLNATNRGINPLATVCAVELSGQSCVGGGSAGTVISRRGAEALSFRHLLLAFGRDDLRVVRYRCGIRFWLLGGTTSVSSDTAAAVASGLLGGMTSVPSGTAAAVASGLLGGTTSVSSGTAAVVASGLLGGMTSVSSGTAAIFADMTNRT